VISPILQVQSFLLEAIARDALGDPGVAQRALERALDLAETDGMLLAFLLRPAPGLLERHARHRTAHASLIAEILSLLAGRRPAPPSAGPQPPLEPLSNSEIRALRYLPTNLSVREIAEPVTLTARGRMQARALGAQLANRMTSRSPRTARRRPPPGVNPHRVRP
jgi:LuxR family maltose regulon positive regulatory protein